MNWTLEHNSVEKTLQAWGLTDVMRTIRTQSADRVTFKAPTANLDAPPLFNYGDTLILRRDGVPWFYGRMIRDPRAGKPAEESLRYELVGPWWYLDDLIYQQDWLVYGNQLQRKGRVILGQDAQGNTLSSAQALADVVNYAIAAGRPILQGTIDCDAPIPKDENKDITCAEAIQKILRWHPDAVTYFDYTTMPYPTLHIRRAVNLPAMTLDLNEGVRIEEVELFARQDLQRSAVVLRYEISGTTDGQAWVSIVTDAHPAGATGDEIGAMVATIPLDGGTVTTVSQKVVTRAIKDDNASASEKVDYWKKIVPALARPHITNIAFEDIPGEPPGTTVARALSDPNELDDDGNPIQLQTDLDNELVHGSITHWMMDEFLVRGQNQTLTANVSFLANGVPQGPILISHQLVATDATTRTYSTLQQFEGGEPVPVGLAQNLHDALSALQYQGRLTLVERECSGVLSVGQRLNLAGGQPEWASMHAVVSELVEEVDSGRSRLTFGPEGHLGPQDLVTLLRVTRPSIAGRMLDGNSGAAAFRAQAKPPRIVGLGFTNANSNTSHLASGGGSAGAPPYPFRLVDQSSAGHARVAVTVGYVYPQADGYAIPIEPQVWSGSQWTPLASPLAAPLQLEDAVGWHVIYLKAQFNFLRYCRKIGILSGIFGLPFDQLPLDTYLATGEDTVGWTTSAGEPDEPLNCGLAHRAIGYAEVEFTGAEYHVKQILMPQDVETSLGLVPTLSGMSIWYRI